MEDITQSHKHETNKRNNAKLKIHRGETTSKAHPEILKIICIELDNNPARIYQDLALKIIQDGQSNEAMLGTINTTFSTL